MATPTAEMTAEDLAARVAHVYGLTGGAQEFANLKRAIRLARGEDAETGDLYDAVNDAQGAAFDDVMDTDAGQVS